MRKLIIMMVALALGGAVQLVPRAVAQTAPPSKDTTTLNAQPMKDGQTQDISGQRKMRNVSRSGSSRNISRARSSSRNVSRGRSSSRNVSRAKTRSRSVSRQGRSNRTGTRSRSRQTVGVGRSGKTGKHVRTGRTRVKQQQRVKTGRTGIKQQQRVKTGRTGIKQQQRVKTGRTGIKQQQRVKTGRTVIKRQRLIRGPGQRRIVLKRGPGKIGVVVRRPIVVFRGPRRIFVNNRWRTFVPLAALGVIVVGGERFYADGYVPLAGPVCAGVTEEGCQLRWQAVPTEDGASEYQCVQYCAQSSRVITEAPPPAPAETTGVAPTEEQPAAAPPPQAPETGCELLIYSQENFKGVSSPADENQPTLGEQGWKNEIASIEVKSGTWDFYSDENFGGEMMRLGVGSYPTLDPKWSKHIGSFMCSTPGK